MCQTIFRMNVADQNAVPVCKRFSYEKLAQHRWVIACTRSLGDYQLECIATSDNRHSNRVQCCERGTSYSYALWWYRTWLLCTKVLPPRKITPHLSNTCCLLFSDCWYRYRGRTLVSCILILIGGISLARAGDRYNSILSVYVDFIA